ncbi:hypothetical protein [Mesorhizobium xinjiangense]|uniref:hypothetical protein n=1 Tax=Mesorhizobium xinjiangense TaxID=2678685 RepID=UPI001F3F09D5|nr:hypothetical protein [Mesorhizobium xinjiangense]
MPKAKLLLTLAATGLLLASVPAEAISRYNSTSMSCARVQAAVQREGAVILRHRSTRNPSLTLYDRYVADGRFCAVGEVADNAWVPTSDRRDCFVRNCRSFDRDRDGFFFRD